MATETAASVFAREIDRLRRAIPARVSGAIHQVVGLTAECRGLSVPMGSLCEIRVRQRRGLPLYAEVVGFREDRTLLMTHGDFAGISPGDPVSLVRGVQTVRVNDHLLGRVIDAAGEPLDGSTPLYLAEERRVHGPPLGALDRRRIDEPLATGVSAIDGLLTIGRGQRMGLFSGSGVGKSVLLGMIARNTAADVTVIALVGERGREVRDFIERDLGEEGLARSVVVVATSDQSALRRVRAPFVATAIAEWFRDAGKDVLLLMDSVTRMALAQREIGLSAGEPAATKGYPPSVFAILPKLLERAGRGTRGSITGIYTVLVEADDLTEPISDSVRGVLDGHVWLSRDLAHRAHYPAVDPLQSVSRVMPDVITREHRAAAQSMVRSMAAYRDAEDFILAGAYARGSNPETDQAIRLMPAINTFLRQEREERRSFEETVAGLTAIAAEVEKAGGRDGGQRDAKGVV